jgi:hypothetical protein
MEEEVNSSDISDLNVVKMSRYLGTTDSGLSYLDDEDHSKEATDRIR